MDYIIVAFRSRTETIMFSSYLKDNGVNNQIVNTPKQAGVGCGLSVKVNVVRFNEVKIAVRRSNLKTFAGYFYVAEKNGVRNVKAI